MKNVKQPQAELTSSWATKGTKPYLFLPFARSWALRARHRRNPGTERDAGPFRETRDTSQLHCLPAGGPEQ